jgi:hypothetical protein
MKAFTPESNMYTLGGVFYPTGHMFVMFPTADDALDGERRVLESGYDGGAICLLTPKDIHEKIAAAVADEDHMPSAGSEADTARHYEELARQGHHALLIPAKTAADAERLKNALKGANVSYAQRYRHFVIEDIVA